MKKYVILFLGISLFTWHLLATFLYLSPVNPLSMSYQPVVKRYMEPFFTQNWGLFAPEPATASLQLFYRCESREWGPWYDVLTPLYREHHAFPLTYRGKLTYIYQSLARELFNSSMKIKNSFVTRNGVSEMQVPKSIAGEKTFDDLAYAINDMCRMQSRDVHSFEFQIVRVYAPDFSKRLSLETGRKEIISFPAVKVGQPKEASYAAHF